MSQKERTGTRCKATSGVAAAEATRVETAVARASVRVEAAVKASVASVAAKEQARRDREGAERACEHTKERFEHVRVK